MELKNLTLRAELKAHAIIAVPLAAAFLAELGMVLTDNIIVGQLGNVHLAAIGLGGNLFTEVLIVCMATVSIVGVLVAQSFGAQHFNKIGHHVRQGFWVAIVLSIPGTILCYFAANLLALTDQNPQVLVLGNQYLQAVAWSFLPVMLFTVLRSYTASLSRAMAIMVITVVAVGLNAVLTYGMVHGKWGFPALGIAGSGWATTIVNWAMFMVMAIYARHSKGLRRYQIFQNLGDLDLAECRQIFRLGLPVGGITMLEAGLFLAVAVMMGTISVHALAANQVVLNAIATMFMLSLAVGEATGIRVAHGMGAGNLAASRYSGLVGLAIGVVIGILAGLLFIFGSDFITGIFLDLNDPKNVQVVSLCASLFVIAAAFQLFDGMQAIAARSLRGMKDVIVPVWIAGFGYWVIGVGGGYMLAFELGLGPTGLWWGLAIGLAFTGIMLALRFNRLSEPVVVYTPSPT